MVERWDPIDEMIALSRRLFESTNFSDSAFYVLKAAALGSFDQRTTDAVLREARYQLLTREVGEYAGDAIHVEPIDYVRLMHAAQKSREDIDAFYARYQAYVKKHGTHEGFWESEE